MFECYKNSSKNHIDDIYSAYEICSYRNNSTISLDDLLLRFNWIDLDKLKLAIKQTGVNIVYILGLDIMKKLTKFEIFTNDSKLEFDNINEYKDYIIYILDSIDGVSDVIIL